MAKWDIRGRSVLYGVLLAAAILGTPGCRSVPVDESSAPMEANREGDGLPTSERTDYAVHYVRRGDTLYSLGRRYGTAWQEIKAHNRLDSFHLEVGQILLVPVTGEGDRGRGAAPAPRGSAARDAAPPVSGEKVGGGSSPTGGDWMWPVEGRLIRRYGDELEGLAEPGIAISAPAGTEIRAAADGQVVCVIQRPQRLSRGWGNVVALRHNQETVSWYAHLESVGVREGQRVRRGEVIGRVGRSGAANVPQLALRMFRNERPVNPETYMP